MQPTPEVILTDSAKRIIKLDDGSTVWLNSNSRLEYSGNFIENRLVEISGEAHFSVQSDPDHPFVIMSPTAITTVLGTEFTVYASDEATQVHVVEGPGAVKFIR